MKTFARILLFPVLALAAWAAWTYPAIGHHSYRIAMALETRVYGLSSSEVDLGDMVLSIYEGGPSDAEPVILIHGYSAEKAHWARFARQLLDAYRVLIPDLAGHGETGFDPEWDYSIPAQAARIKAMMDARGIKKGHLVGNSMGGFIAAYFAWQYPQHTLSATLVDAAGVRSPEPSVMEIMLADGRNPFQVKSREDFRRFYAMTMQSPPWVPGHVLDAQAEHFIARADELAAIFEDFHFKNMLDERLHEIQPPVLVLWGARDQLIHVSASKVWSSIPGAELTIWDDIGHMPHVEIPALSGQRVRQFIDQH